MHPLLLFTLLFLPGYMAVFNPEIVKKVLVNYPLLDPSQRQGHRFAAPSQHEVRPIPKPAVSFEKDDGGHNVFIPKSQGTRTNVRGTIEYFTAKLDKDSGKYIPNGYVYHKFEIKGPESHVVRNVSRPKSDLSIKPSKVITCPHCNRMVTHPTRSNHLVVKKPLTCPHCSKVFFSPKEVKKNIKARKLYIFFMNKNRGNDAKKLFICPLCKKVFLDSHRNLAFTSNKYRICPVCRYFLVHPLRNAMMKPNSCTCCPKSRNYNAIYSTANCPCCKCSSKLAKGYSNRNKTIYGNYFLINKKFVTLNKYPFLPIRYSDSKQKTMVNDRTENFPTTTESYPVFPKPKGQITRNYYHHPKQNDFTSKYPYFRPYSLNKFKYSAHSDKPNRKLSNSFDQYRTNIEKPMVKDDHLKKNKNFQVEISKENNIDITFRNLYRDSEDKFVQTQLPRPESGPLKGYSYRPTSTAIMKINSKTDNNTKNFVIERLKKIFPSLAMNKLLEKAPQSTSTDKSIIHSQPESRRADLFKENQPKVVNPVNVRYLQRNNRNFIDHLMEPLLF